MKNPAIPILAALALLVGGAGSSKADSIVVNGGFETGSFSPWTEVGPFAGVGTSGLVEGVGPIPNDPGPYDGTYAAYLGAGHNHDILSQTLTTTPGQNYTIGFFLADVDSSVNFVDFFTIKWNGSQVANLTSFPSNTWAHYSFTVTGTGSDTLQFISQANGTFVLDDVSDAELPEPSSLTMLVLGLASIGAFGWMKKRNDRKSVSEESRT